MYIFEKSLLREKGENAPYRNVDISNMKLSVIYKTYNDGFITLSNSALTTLTHVSLFDLRSASNLVYADLPFSTWLSVQGNATIFGSTDIEPTLSTGVISFSDAIQAGFTINQVNPNDLAGVNTYPKDMLKDIFAIKNVADPTILHKYVLTSVNGLYHINIPSGKGLLIKDGGKSFNLENDNHIGILSFEFIGEIEQVPIREEMIQPATAGKEYRKAVYLNLKRDLRNKSLIFCFAGGLHIANGLIDIVNYDGVIRLNMHKLDIFTILQRAIGKIDTSDIVLERLHYMRNSFQPEKAIDDNTVLAMLEMMQSFMVIVDTPNLLTEKQAMNYVNTPGFYETYKNTRLPYVDDYGIMHPYWKIIHQEEYANVHQFNLKNTSYVNPLHETTGYRNPKFEYSDMYQFQPRTIFNIGNLLKIYGQKIVME